MILKAQPAKYRDTIFSVTEENSCPIYIAGEEFRVENNTIITPGGKPTCLRLARPIMEVASVKNIASRFTSSLKPQNSIDCDGCTGSLKLEMQRTTTFSTLQMKLLAAMDNKSSMSPEDNLYELLRNQSIFESLPNDSLENMAKQLALKECEAGEIIIHTGDQNTPLYIVFKGTVSVINDKDQKIIATLGSGNIFGEMNLLTKETAIMSVQAKETTTLAVFPAKDFKHLLARFPALQFSFYRLLMDRVQANALHAGTISSGMSGHLSDISAVDLFQLINHSQKTGRVQLLLDQESAEIVFREGEIIKATFSGVTGTKAFFSALAQHEGAFIFSSGIAPHEAKLEPIGSFMGLLMEGARLLDEAGS